MTPEIDEGLKVGLTVDDWNDLNRPPMVYPGGNDARNLRMDELRQKYTDNRVALQQIDLFDFNSPYCVKTRLALEARAAGDQKRFEELYAWLKEHYPDIGE